MFFFFLCVLQLEYLELGAEGRGASRGRAPPKIFRPCNIYIKDSYSSLSLSNPVTSTRITDNNVTRRLKASAALFSIPDLCFKTNEYACKYSTQ